MNHHVHAGNEHGFSGGEASALTGEPSLYPFTEEFLRWEYLFFFMVREQLSNVPTIGNRVKYLPRCRGVAIRKSR